MNNMTKKTGFYTVILFMTIGFSSPVLSQNPVDDFFLGQTINNLGALAGPGSRQDRLDDFGRRSLNTLGEALMYSAQIQAQKEIAEAGRPQQNINVNATPQQQYVQPQNTQYTPQYSGKITNLEVLHNRTLEDGLNGMEIIVNGNVYNLVGSNIEIITHFHFPNGELLRDIDGNYKTVDEKVCIYKGFNAPYANTQVELSLKMPYEQLHLSRGKKHDVIGLVSIVTKTDPALLLARESFSFYVNNP